MIDDVEIVVEFDPNTNKYFAKSIDHSTKCSFYGDGETPEKAFENLVKSVGKVLNFDEN